MKSTDVLAIYNSTKESGVRIWIDGGWCVDALLGEQTREHPDLDLAMSRKDEAKLKRLLESMGYRQEQRNDSTAWNYVLKNDNQCQVDIHVFEFDDQNKNIYGIEYPYESLSGHGFIDGHEVECISPEWMFKFKSGYSPKEKDIKDVQALSDKFGYDLPQGYQK